MDITHLSIGGEGFSFPDTISPPITVLEGSSTAFKVRFSPSKSKTYEGEVTIGTSIGLAQVLLLGEGLGPQILIDPESYNFGGVAEGKSKKYSFKITNTGNWFAVIYEISVDG